MKNKKILKIVTISLSAIMLAGLTSSIAIKTIKETHTCQTQTVISYNNDSHYYKCKNLYCDNRFAEKDHEVTWVVDKEETCEENGIKHQECYCGYRRNIGTTIDEFKYDSNIQLIDNLTRNTYSNEWDDGNHSPTLELNLGKFENERNNTSFKARYQLATDLKYKYVYSNMYNDSISFLYSGFTIYDANGESYNIRLSIVPKAEHEYILEIATANNGIYRLINNDVTSLCKDYVKNGYLDVDFGVYETEIFGLVYGFRFKTANNEITYLSDNSGTIKSETKLVKYLDNTIDTDEIFTFNDVLGFVGTDGIYNNGDSAITVMNRNWTGRDTYGTLVSCNSASAWLMNQVKYLEWLNS